MKAALKIKVKTVTTATFLNLINFRVKTLAYTLLVLLANRYVWSAHHLKTVFRGALFLPEIDPNQFFFDRYRLGAILETLLQQNSG